MKLLPALILSLAMSGSLAAAPAPLVLVDGDIRPALELSGPWHWSVDPYRDGLAGFHGEPPGVGHQRYADVDAEDAAAKDPNALFEQDMKRSPVTTLPSSWITHDPTMRHYDGLVWYQRRFAAAPRAGHRYFLRFGAADYRAYVYANGKRVGEHEGGFTPFAFEVTGLLRNGEPGHGRSRFRAVGRQRSTYRHRLGNLWRDHAARAAHRNARNLRRRRVGAPDA